jgi:hypothetical protein
VLLLHQPPRGNFRLLLPRSGDCIYRARALDPACFAAGIEAGGREAAVRWRVWRRRAHSTWNRRGATHRNRSSKRGSPPRRRRVAIGKRLRRPPTSSKVADKRKRSSSPLSSSSSIRSTEPDPRRPRYDLHKSIAYTTDSLPYFVFSVFGARRLGFARSFLPDPEHSN